MAGRLDAGPSGALRLQLEADLESLACISDCGPGVTRLAWTDAYAKASEWLAGRMRAEGLDTLCDQAGNLIGRLDGEIADGSGAIAVGSHIDTVPEGGRYDGALGVLAGLAIASDLKSERTRLRHPIWIVAFMDEEGARFGTSLFGSRAFSGEAPLALDRIDADGVSIAEAMEAAGYDPDRLGEARRIDSLGTYLELHIEQGPTLDDSGYDVGVVTAIVGRRVLRIRIEGSANHAGTTPQSHRRDALRAAAEIATALHATFDRTTDCTMNIGRIEAWPGAANVIPGAASLDVEFRSSGIDGLDGAEEALRGAARTIIEANDLSCEVEHRESVDPIECDPHLVELLERAAAEQSASVTRLVGGAGHDALIMARHIPTAVLMVPSRHGLSHAPDEYTDINHCVLGTRVLGTAVRELALSEHWRAT